ncbi:antitermination protein Q [Cronobacter sakazakii]|nr:antitermination protein Q [Cronobacter sakazakii]CCJ88130.1 Antitermination protein Q [Cronobacter turicensis 564]ELY2474506.1 antitermination protein Q [Cronobacter sakazakii]ELY4750335.1 antitermination protein Q [Cronobacter sakazakii]ELY5776857.1 antitermination protein Q [Cronobacter sakazakii]
MRDIQKVLELWGGWAANDNSGVDYSSIAAGFKGLLPQTSRSRLSCSDNDALIIEGCLARLKQRKPYEHSLLVAYYLYRIPKRRIARARKKDEKLIRIEMQMAEGFIDGCLAMLEVSLEMDI